MYFCVCVCGVCVFVIDRRADRAQCADSSPAFRVEQMVITGQNVAPDQNLTSPKLRALDKMSFWVSFNLGPLWDFSIGPILQWPYLKLFCYSFRVYRLRFITWETKIWQLNIAMGFIVRWNLFWAAFPFIGNKLCIVGK